MEPKMTSESQEALDYTVLSVNPRFLAERIIPILESTKDSVLVAPHTDKDFIEKFTEAILLSVNPEIFSRTLGFGFHNDRLSKNDSIRHIVVDTLKEILVDIFMYDLEKADPRSADYKEIRARNAVKRVDLKQSVISKLAQKNTYFSKLSNPQQEKNFSNLMEQVYSMLEIVNYILGGKLPEEVHERDKFIHEVSDDPKVKKLRDDFYNKSSANSSGNALENLIPTHMIAGLRYKGLVSN